MTAARRDPARPWVHPVRRGWVVRGEVSGPDADEFAEPERVAEALAAPGAAGSLFAVQHPHRTPQARREGLGLADALPAARAALDELRRTGYRPVADVVAPYRIGGADGESWGLLCMVDPAAVDAAGLSRVRHGEEVYPDVVAERAAMLAGLGTATSAAMLVPVVDGHVLTAAVREVTGALGEPEVATVDGAGREHRLWLLGPGPEQDRLLHLAGRHPLLVADGNHRVAAAAAARLDGLLSLVTAGPRLRIGPIHRVLTGTGLSAGALADAWRRVGMRVRHGGDPEPPTVPGGVVVLAGGSVLRVDLPAPGPDEPLPRIDHAAVERLLVADALGVDPEGPHLRPLPDHRPPPPEADAVLLLAPVPYRDVLAVHAQGRRMPRKSTYFTPKPRSGLLLADLGR
jgi:hypothetical protein